MTFSEDIPIPPSGRKATKYGFEHLKKYNDSVFIECKTKDYDRVRGAAHKYGKSNNFNTVTRKYNTGVRVWRTTDRED